SVENADLKVQIQEKVFANAALINELRKLKGNIVYSKFTKASILGKPPLQLSRNHLVVRQPKVDEKKDLSKTVTPHYLPKVRESAAAKPHQVNAPNYSRNSHKESYVAREVHATHARIVSGPDLEPMQEDQTGSNSGKLHVSLAGSNPEHMDDVVNSLMHMLPNNIQIIDTNSFIVLKKRCIQTLTPTEQEAADIMKALKESKKMSKRQPGAGGSNEGTGNILGVPDESTVISKASS
ncbi:hypothetical protein Tco_1127471, partial [Tanacetum coccineum]